MPRPSEPVSREALTRYLVARGVAPYKFPDKVIVVRQIPRDENGRILREQILR
jgi:non-ribosomal peptide synthetase component E (peptide arylation enzyme)